MEITQDMFDSKLTEILGRQTADRLLAVPGIYEVVSEHFNNEVLDAIAEDREGRC